MLVAGCGPAVGTVSGDVTFDGKPLGGAVISFVNPDGTIRTAIANAAGHYAVDHLPTGPVQVTVRPPQPTDTSDGRTTKKPERPTPAPRREKSVVPDRYAGSTSSGLATTIKPGPNRYDIALTP